jgi:predicted metal-binding protein
MHLKSYKYPRVVLVCTDCEKRDDGPRHLDSKAGVSALRQDLREGPGKVRVMRTRCLGLCPRKALAAVALGAGLPAMAAELRDADDLAGFARYAGSAKG